MMCGVWEPEKKLGDCVCGEKAEVVEERGNEDKKNLTSLLRYFVAKTCQVYITKCLKKTFPNRI